VADEVVAENFRRARARAIEEFEKRYVEDLLRKHDGNVTRAALEANKDRRAFGRLKKKYKIA
jgi:two-component system response regulator GlrR